MSFSCCAGKEISEEEGANSLKPSSTNVAGTFWLKLYGHRRKSVSGDINAQHGWGAACVLESLNALNCAVQLLVGWKRFLFMSR